MTWLRKKNSFEMCNILRATHSGTHTRICNKTFLFIFDGTKLNKIVLQSNNNTLWQHSAQKGYVGTVN